MILNPAQPSQIFISSTNKEKNLGLAINHQILYDFLSIQINELSIQSTDLQN